MGDTILLLMVHSLTAIPLKNKVQLHNIKTISSTPQKTHCASITKIIWLTPFREISLFILRTRWKHTHSVAKNALLVHIVMCFKRGGKNVEFHCVSNDFSYFFLVYRELKYRRHGCKWRVVLYAPALLTQRYEHVRESNYKT